MAKYRFAIVGSGWRAQYYIRIAKALPKEFELCDVLCRSEEKAILVCKEFGIKATTSETELERDKPDFVVVAVSKASGAEVAMKWMDKGFTVLLETPAGLNLETLNCLWNKQACGQKIVIAEQYSRYPQYSALIDLIKMDILGECSMVNLSVAHDYHGASLIRSVLDIPVDMGFTVSSKTYEFPTTETLSRYEEIHDGRIADKKRRIAVFEFDNGKVAVYDFDSEQYRSPIRKNTYKIQGVMIIDLFDFLMDNVDGSL